MLNKVFLMGRMVRDPELRRTQSGTAVTSFTIACDRDFKDTDGERKTDFIDMVAWRNTAEFVSKYFKKGRMVVVEGRMQIRDWTDKDGNKRRATEIIVDNIYFADNARNENAAPPAQQPAPPVEQPPMQMPSQFQEEPLFPGCNESSDYPTYDISDEDGGTYPC